MIKFLFTADIHANKTRSKDVVKYLNNLYDYINDNKVNYLLIGGDLWDSAINNTKASGFIDVISAIKRISEICNVIAIYGTSTHDSSGSLDVLKTFGCIVIEKPAVLDLDDMRLLCIPEPRRSNFVRDTVQETTLAMNQYLENACKNLVDVIIYHGEISSARLDNGSLAKSDVQLTKAMIDNTNAQLVLAGHIHSPQKLFNNTYYVGSPIPCNFGENHNPSFITFSCDNHKVSAVKRIETGFPIKKQFECDKETYEKMYKFKYPNTDIKLKLSLTAEEKLLFNIRKEEERFKAETNASSVKISIFTKKEISVRSSEIAKVTTPEEKLKIYGEVNNINITESLINKLAKIEENLMIQYNFPVHSFELLSVDIKGAKGIRNYEQYSVDFTKYADGILGLISPNGAGKSTFLELCSPYARMLTRGGALRSHFYLKDSHRIVIFRDENRRLYKLTAQMNASIDTGLCKYFAQISDDNGETWNNVSECNGNLDAYSKWVKETFGSIELYLKTAFFTQGKVKGINDIANATKGERISLMSELLGFDNLSAIHDLIKDEIKRINDEIKQYPSPENEINELNSEISHKNTILTNYIDDLSELEEEIAQTEEDLKKNKKLKEDFDKNYGKYENAVELRDQVENKVAEIQDHLNSLREHKVKNDFFKSHKPEIEEYRVTLDSYNELKTQSKKITDKYSAAQEELLEATTEYNKAERQVDIEERKLSSADDKIKNAMSSVYEIGCTCPTCGAKLSEKKRAQLMKAQEYQLVEIDALKQFKETQKTIVSECKKSLTSANTRLKKAKANKSKYQADLDEFNVKYNATEIWLDNNDYSEYLDYAEVGNLEEDIERTKETLINAKDQLSALEGIELVDYVSIVEELEERNKKNNEFKLRLSVDKGTVETEIKNLNEKLSEVMKYAEILRNLSAEHEEYMILEKAFSNGGIPALELEANAPEIALLTNQILNDCYGDKFYVSLSTLRASKDKLIDDFSIDVTNTETGWTVPIEMLSQGERIWVIQSLFFAFSIIRQEKTGFNFLVRFVDESDGALDSEARLKYVSMLQGVHKSANSRLTIMVTHSQEVKDLLSQTIKL